MTADAAECASAAISEWLHSRGRPGREILTRQESTRQRRALVQAHQRLGDLLGRPLPGDCPERFKDAHQRLAEWHETHTPLPDLLDIGDLQFVATGAKVMNDVAGELEATLSDAVLASLGTPLTAKEMTVLEIIEQHSPNGIKGPGILAELSKRGLRTKQSTLTRHIIPKLKEMAGVANRRGAGYYVPM